MNHFATSGVRPHNGVPTLFVDGQPLHGMTATSVAFDEASVVRGFVEGGVEIMMIWIEAPLKCWLGPGQYDWSYAEEKLRFFAEHSGDTKWLIRVRLGIVARWFGEAFPSEVHDPHSTGASVSVIHSPIWLDQVSGMVADFVRWLETTEWASRIIGFMLNAGSTEEWLPFDTEAMFQGKYHPVIEREFRGWLHRKYLTDGALQKAWKDDGAGFKNAMPPRGMARRGSHIWGLYTLRDPEVDRPAIDYYRFLNETLADALIHFCRTVKEASRTPVICGGFHSYLWWETGVYSYIQEYGHGLIQRLNRSPWVDFVSDITSYDGRYPGGPSGYLGLPASLNLNNKLHYTEVDLSTHLNMSPEMRAAWEASDKRVAPGTSEPILPERTWKWDKGMCGRDEEEQVAVLEREAVHNLITGTPYWWFDIKARSYASPGLTAAMAGLSDLGKSAVHWDRASLAEVAFVVSEDTPMFQSAMNGSLMRFEMEAAHSLLIDGCTKQWGLAGVPFDTFELHDLAHPNFPGEKYKLLIFLNCARVSEAAAAGIRRWQNGGRTLLWTFASACLSEEDFAPALGEELVGMRLDCLRERRVGHVELTEDHGVLSVGRQALNFGTDIAIGPVFFASDDRAQVLGRLRDGGEPAFAVREHRGASGDWNALYLSLPNFGAGLLRNLARFAGAHVWIESDDVLYANQSLLCLHTASAGTKTISLPRPARVTEISRGGASLGLVREFDVTLEAYRTRTWRLEFEK